MGTQQSQRCNKCVIPNNCDLIPFAEDGTCSLCKTAQEQTKLNPPKPFDEKELLAHIERIREKGKGRPYDCVVGVSGGRDSTYLLYLLRKKHNLRCLAVYYRTPFTHDLIDANIRRISKDLGADFEDIQLSREYHRVIAKEMINLWRKRPQRIIINLACAPCKLLNREIYKIASRHNVPTLIYGTNIYEAVQIAPGVSKKQVLVKGNTGVFSVFHKVRNMCSLVWNGVKLLFTAPEILKHLFLGIQSSVMYISHYTLYLALRYPKIKTFDYFYGGQWNEADCEKTLNELGWQRPPGCNSSWKADCCFAEIKNVLFQKTVGITYGEAFFSNMVRAGIITREEAMHRLQTEGKLSEQRLKETQQILELDDNFIKDACK